MLKGQVGGEGCWENQIEWGEKLDSLVVGKNSAVVKCMARCLKGEIVSE